LRLLKTQVPVMYLAWYVDMILLSNETAVSNGQILEASTEKVERKIAAKRLRCLERYLGISDTILHIPLPAKLLPYSSSHIQTHTCHHTDPSYKL
jgi:hypothetical protein